MDGWEEPCSKKQTLPSFYGLTFIFVSKFVFIINIINTAPPHLLQTCYNCWANGNTCTVTHEKLQNGSQNVQYTVNTLKIVSSLFFNCWLQSREGWFTFDLFSPPSIPLQLHGRFFYLSAGTVARQVQGFPPHVCQQSIGMMSCPERDEFPEAPPCQPCPGTPSPGVVSPPSGHKARL